MRISDWSSDVCSSDLAAHIGAAQIDEGIDPGNAGDHAAVLIGQGHRRLDFAHADPIELAGNTGPDLTGDIGHLTGGVLGVDRRHVASLLIDSIDNVAPLRCMRCQWRWSRFGRPLYRLLPENGRGLFETQRYGRLSTAPSGPRSDEHTSE